MTGEVAVLIGGPRDGEEVCVRDGAEVVNVADLRCLPAVMIGDATTPEAVPFNVLQYRLARDPLGWRSRDDRGRLRYVLHKM